jgi:hypothetical protein
MNPIPCSHCGVNFMRHTPDSEAPKLCNNCVEREKVRNPMKEIKKEETIKITIECPIKIQSEIEELCINRGIDFSTFFMNIYYNQCKEPGALKKIIKEIELEANLLSSQQLNFKSLKPSLKTKKSK